jgi:hypothetical protein
MKVGMHDLSRVGWGEPPRRYSSILRRLGLPRLAIRHELRAYDAIHLASASIVRQAEEVVFSCWDRELRAAAAAEDFELNP